MSALRNLTRIEDANDDIVVVKALSDITGGRTLDVSAWSGSVIRAGHIIIQKADGTLAPLGVSDGKYVLLSSGQSYAGVLKTTIVTTDPRASVFDSGIVNAAASPYDLNAEIVSGLPRVIFDNATVIPTYTVTATAGGHGSVTASATKVLAGGSVTLMAKADEGYEFQKWSDNNTTNPRTVTNIQANVTLSAVFQLKK